MEPHWDVSESLPREDLFGHIWDARKRVLNNQASDFTLVDFIHCQIDCYRSTFILKWESI